MLNTRYKSLKNNNKKRKSERQSELVAKSWSRAERLDNLGNFYFETIALFMYCNIEQMNICCALELFKHAW